MGLVHNECTHQNTGASFMGKVTQRISINIIIYSIVQRQRMSNKKQRRQSDENTSSHPRDQQFKVQTLASDSSEDGSRKDHEHYDTAYLDVSDEDHDQPGHQNSKTKSMQDFTVIPNDKQPSPTAAGNEQQNAENIQQTHHNPSPPYELKQNVSQTVNGESKLPDEEEQENSIKKKKRKRQQIYKNIRHKNIAMESMQQKRTQNKERETLNKLAFQRKRQNHALLKQWNYNRINIVEKHRRVIDQLLSNIDKNVKLSLQNFQVYKTFYAHRFRQEESYAGSKVSGTQRFSESESSQSNNKVGRNIYIACSTVLQSLAQKDRAKRELAAELCTVLQTKILKQIFDEYLDNVHKQSRALRSKISRTKQILTELDESICKKLIKLEANFTECCQNIVKEAGEDFYCLQLSFMRKCESEVKLQIEYGRMIMKYWKYVASEEEVRGQLVEKSLKIYRDAYSKYSYGIKALSKQKQKKSKGSEPPAEEEPLLKQSLAQQVSQLYRVQNLLEPQLMAEIWGTNASNESGNRVEQLVAYLLKCEIQQFDFHHLLLKKFSIELLKEHRWIPSELVITVDKFVHIFVNALTNSGVLVYGGQQFYKPEATLKACETEIRFTTEKQIKEEIDSDDELEIVIANKQTQSGLGKLASMLISQHKVAETVRFSKEDDLLEFQDFITELSF